MDKAVQYYKLTKPGVLFANALSSSAGFLFAAQGHIDFLLFVWLTIGMTLVIASACVLNNYLDQDIDRLMTRTKKRPLIQGTVSGRGAVIFAVILGVLGVVTLALTTSFMVTVIAIIGFVTYVVLYGMWSKRQSVHGTLVGGISGAIPILAGYAAAAGVIDIGAVLVFLVLFFWQMPEFYSIAIYRREEYKKAGVPVISVVKGVDRTKQEIFFYTVAFVLSALLISAFGYAGYVYMIVMTLLGAYWIKLGAVGLKTKDSEKWARKMFRFSLVILLAFCFLISVEALLP